MDQVPLPGTEAQPTGDPPNLAEIEAVVERVVRDHAEALEALETYSLIGLLRDLESGQEVDYAEFRDGAIELRGLLDYEILEHFNAEEALLFPALRRHRRLLDAPLATLERIAREHHEFADRRAEFNLAAEALDEPGDASAIIELVAPHARAMCEFLGRHVRLEDEAIAPVVAALERLKAAALAAADTDAPDSCD